MKSILLFSLALALAVSGISQPWTIGPPPDIWSNTEISDPVTGYNETFLSGDIMRSEGVRYNHYSPIFNVSNKGWISPLNVFNPYGQSTNNTDYFLFQGESFIRGEDGVVSFDTLRLNIGANNTMHIENSNGGYLIENPTSFQGQPPGGISISRALYFNNGITTTLRDKPVNGAIVFVNSAFYTGGLTDAQHVDGFVSEANYPGGDPPPGHNGDFTFPVGNGNAVYQLRRQGVFEETDHTLTVGWVDGDPGDTPDPTRDFSFSVDPFNPTSPASIYLPPEIAGVAKAGFWDWHYQDASITPNPNAYNGKAMANEQIITVSLPDLSGYPGLLPGELRLIGYVPGLKWILLGGTGATGLTKGSLLTGTIPAGQVISAIAIGSTNNIILPVTFTSFTVKAEGCKALLEWQTGMEQNNSHFVVERSTNGSEFTAIGRVSAVGNSNTTNTYKFTDEATASGVNYYRITQVDFDGKHSGTEVKAIRIQCNGNMVVLKAYPNPAASQVNIQSGKAIAQVNVVATNGQTVMKYVPSQNQGGTFSLNIQRVQNGIYLLQIVNKDGTIDVIKLLKQ
ncbi:T9SS type A sorting domain-containing protein [Agriterribacter sp.]|uniref:T9SS type A sorting domain-containing protein n=1 Tax=Agriterribacter sp. TaxID=2821509 RepID=UPI002C0AEC05|nr:T9SS type A sorting domain-containing protein [Agriterribacter sp.]HRO47082.1 T9SS type A sorting domain-containing protein [Agriterribacter sp.]HRQ18763.1 T9SS type A sorting domain-containing protein [Agriterribacter sp.]